MTDAVVNISVLIVLRINHQKECPVVRSLTPCTMSYNFANCFHNETFNFFLGKREDKKRVGEERHDSG